MDITYEIVEDEDVECFYLLAGRRA